LYAQAAFFPGTRDPAEKNGHDDTVAEMTSLEDGGK
jgi:phosphopantetheine adenylyltransferase